MLKALILQSMPVVQVTPGLLCADAAESALFASYDMTYNVFGGMLNVAR